MARKAGLGRGLDALFADVAPIEEGYNADSLKDLSGTADKKNKDEKAATDRDRIIYIDINDIRPNSAQPRTVFDEEKLKELADSIKANGVIQPLLVRESGGEPPYIITDGERRWGTVGVSPNLIEAAWQALLDSVEYKLLGSARAPERPSRRRAR